MGGLWTEHLHVVAYVACLNRSHDSVCEYEHTDEKGAAYLHCMLSHGNGVAISHFSVWWLKTVHIPKAV